MDNASTGGPDALERKLRRFMPTSAERALLSGFSGRRLEIDAGEELVSALQPPRNAYVLHAGWASVYRQMEDGSRQIIDFRLPGDFIGFASLLMRRLDYSIVALTGLIVSEISVPKLISALRQSPLLAEGILWSLSRDIAIMAEHIVNVGQRDSLSRTIHLLIELGYRLDQTNSDTPSRYECPLTQKDLAEALGITHVHLNRVLRYLRDHDLLTFNGHEVVLHDLGYLRRLADFNDAYLSGGG